MPEVRSRLNFFVEIPAVPDATGKDRQFRNIKDKLDQIFNGGDIDIIQNEQPEKLAKAVYDFFNNKLDEIRLNCSEDDLGLLLKLRQKLRGGYKDKPHKLKVGLDAYTSQRLKELVNQLGIIDITRVGVSDPKLAPADQAQLGQHYLQTPSADLIEQGEIDINQLVDKIINLIPSPDLRALIKHLKKNKPEKVRNILLKINGGQKLYEELSQPSVDLVRISYLFSSRRGNHKHKLLTRCTSMPVAPKNTIKPECNKARTKDMFRDWT